MRASTQGNFRWRILLGVNK